MKKRFFALTVALVMLIAMALPFMAMASPQDPGTIILTTDDPRSFAGLDFRAYRVFSLHENTPGVFGYVIDPSFSAFVTTNRSGLDPLVYPIGLSGTPLLRYIYTLVGDVDNNPTPGGVDPRMRALSEDLLSFVRVREGTPNQITPGANASSGVDAQTKTLTLGPLDPGYYLITGQVANLEVPEHVGHVSSFLALVNTGEQLSIDISPKYDQPTVEKRYITPGTNDAKLGTVIPYEVSLVLPLNLGIFDKYILTVKDEMTRGLTFNTHATDIHQSVQVRVNDPNSAAIPNTNQEAFFVDVVQQSPGNGYITTVTIDFKENYILNVLKPGDKLFITYSATLNEHALNDELEYIDGVATNSVTVDYSNNPWDWEDKGTTPPEIVKVYTTDINILKFTGSLEGANTKLPGAQFVLSENGAYDVPTDNDRSFVDDISEYIPVIFLADESSTTTSIYRVAKPGEEGVKVMTSPEGGEIQIRGLGSGLYYLYETVAPSNYQRLNNPIAITVTHIYEDGAPTGMFTITYAGGSGTVNVVNNVASLFPETGGIGRTILYVGGIVVMAGAGAALLIRRRVTSR